MKILNIVFISKPKAKSFTKGIAKYVIDSEGYIVDEWVELLEGTEFRGKNNYGNDFDKSIVNFRKEIMSNDKNNEILSEEKLKKVNLYFLKNLKTILNHDKFTTGSNPSGSNFNIKRTPYIIYTGKYNQFMFINFFKNYRKKQENYKRNINLEEISLEKYLYLFPKIGIEFNNFNKILFTALESNDENEETLKIDTSEDILDIIDLIISNNYKIDLKNEKEKNELRILKLRRIFKNRLKLIKPTDHLFGKLPEDMCEAAHIFPVSEIKKLDIKYWYMIADENNGINLPIQFHKLYDNNKIYFSKEGEIYFMNNQYKDYLDIIFCGFNKYKILDTVLNEKRIKYIQKYNKEILKI